MWCVVRCVADFNFFAKSFNPYTRLEVVRIHWHISFMCYLLRLCDGRLRLKTNRFCCGIHHFAKRFCLCAMRRHVDGEIYRFIIMSFEINYSFGCRTNSRILAN